MVHNLKRQRTLSVGQSVDNLVHLHNTFAAGALQPLQEEQFDVREELFEAIPEPITRPQLYQKVVITETGEEVDQDTLLACKQLKECLNLRKKWLGAHPPAPQNVSKSFDDIEKSITYSDLLRPRSRSHIESPRSNSITSLNNTNNSGSNNNSAVATTPTPGGSMKALQLPPDLGPESPIASALEASPTAATVQIHPDMYRRRFVPNYQIFERPILHADDLSLNIQLVDGVMTVTKRRNNAPSDFSVPSFTDFVNDFNTVRFVVTRYACDDNALISSIFNPQLLAKFY